MRLALGLLLLVAAAAPAAQELRPWTGGAAPTLALEDLEGRPHRLEDYRGKVVLVNFWATWCEPCREEMPSLVQLRAALGPRRFEVLAVNLAEPVSRIRAFREKVPMDFPILLDRDTAAARAWKAGILPASFVVGPDGSIAFSHLGELDWSREKVRLQIETLLPN